MSFWGSIAQKSRTRTTCRARQALLSRLLAGEIPSYRFEKRYLCKDGTPVWVRVQLSSSPGTMARPIRISVVEDISERKRTRGRPPGARGAPAINSRHRARGPDHHETSAARSVRSAARRSACSDTRPRR